MPDELVDAIANMRESDALALAQKKLDDGTDPMAILNDCRAAVEIVGKKFEQGEYFLPELMMAGEMLKQISTLVKPRLQGASAENKRGSVIVGTVKGDIHDIGKDMVVFMLDANGFEVHDLGVDVPAQTFVEKIAAIQPDVVGLSGFLTVAFDAMKKTIAAIDAAGQRNRVKIMIGGGTVDEHVRGYVGADAYGKDAMAAVTFAQKWTREK
jgi:methanogenic corrinoid protein MtbC1